MGRAGITLLDVEKAARQLQGQGKNPTVDAIREILGTGSKSTIIQHLKNWKSKTQEGEGNLPPDLLALVTGLWERLNTQADERILEIDKLSQEQLQKIKDDLLQSQRVNVDMKSSLLQLEARFATECATRIEFADKLQLEQQAHAKLHERHEIQIQQLNDYKAENVRLHQLATSIQTNLEHYQNATQQARAEQALAAEKQQIQHQQKLNILENEISLYIKQVQALNQQSNQLSLELKLANEQYHSLQAKHDTQKNTLQDYVRELTVYKERCDQTHQQLLAAQEADQHKSSQLTEFEKQVAILTDQRNRMQSELLTANDKIELLREEKFFLAHEKSNLENSIKQLQQALIKETEIA